MSGPPSEEVSATLGGDVGSIAGFDWPPGKQTESSLCSIESPKTLFVRTHTGNMIRLHSQAITLHQVNRKLRQIDCLPLEDLADFKASVEELSDLAREIGVEDRPSFRERLAELRAAAHEPGPFDAVLIREEVEPHIEVVFELKPHASGRGWFIAISFYDMELFDIGPDAPEE